MKETERERQKVEGVEGVERVKVKPKSPRTFMYFIGVGKIGFLSRICKS